MSALSATEHSFSRIGSEFQGISIFYLRAYGL